MRLTIFEFAMFREAATLMSREELCVMIPLAEKAEAGDEQALKALRRFASHVLQTRLVDDGKAKAAGA